MSQSILVPLDGSRPSKAALEYAVSNHPSAEITVLHVVEFSARAAYGDTLYHAVDHEPIEEAAAEVMDEAKLIADDYGIEITTTAESGSAANVIIDFVRENDIDRIIMGSHCRTGVKRLILGSVAERVVRRSSVPVTIVR